jgi:hypothetical protein
MGLGVESGDYVKLGWTYTPSQSDACLVQTTYTVITVLSNDTVTVTAVGLNSDRSTNTLTFTFNPRTSIYEVGKGTIIPPNLKIGDYVWLPVESSATMEVPIQAEVDVVVNAVARKALVASYEAGNVHETYIWDKITGWLLEKHEIIEDTYSVDVMLVETNFVYPPSLESADTGGGVNWTWVAVGVGVVGVGALAYYLWKRSKKRREQVQPTPIG